MVFIIGFALHSMNFVIATFIEPSLRRELKEMVARSGISAESRRIFWTSFLLENIFRVVFVLFSFYQMITIGSPQIAFCAQQSDALTIPAAWTFNLAMAQLVFVPSFTLWRFLVNFEDDDAEKPVEIKIEFKRAPVESLGDISDDEDPFKDSDKS